MTDTMQSPASNTPGAEPIIRIEAVDKWYGKFQVLTDIHLNVAAGGGIVVCGASGSGKSPLIRCINPLGTVQKSRIVGDGINLTPPGKKIDLWRQEVGTG